VTLVTCDDFTCFEAYGDYKIDSLFTEYVKLSDKQEPLVFPLIQAQKLSESELIDESESDLTNESESNLVTRVLGQKYLLSSTNKYDLTQ
jgi:hypothetical protein